MLAAPWQQHGGTRTCIKVCFADGHLHVSFQHIEDLVLVVMDVPWRLTALGLVCLDEREPPIGICSTHENTDQGAEIPRRVREAHLLAVQVMAHLRLFW